MAIALKSDYGQGLVASEDPMVVVLEKFVSDEEVDALVSAAKDQLRRAFVSAEREGVTSDGRTGSNCWVSHQHNPVIGGLAERVSEFVGIPLEYAESFQVIHYGETQEYRAHYDAWDPTTVAGARCMERGGQRLVTCLIYLNDVPAGGSTGFPHLDMEVLAKRGRMLIFHNCRTGTSDRHPDSLHAGMPVEKGEKWACNLWFREKPYQQTSVVARVAGKGPKRAPGNRGPVSRSKSKKARRRR